MTNSLKSLMPIARRLRGMCLNGSILGWSKLPAAGTTVPYLLSWKRMATFDSSKISGLSTNSPTRTNIQWRMLVSASARLADPAAPFFHNRPYCQIFANDSTSSSQTLHRFHRCMHGSIAMSNQSHGLVRLPSQLLEVDGNNGKWHF